MPKIKKRSQLQNLAKIRTWLTDDNPFSEYFRLAQMPEILPGGKSGFLINGSPNLVRTTEVLIELTDIDGNVVFTQPIKNYQEGLARVVSIEVYDDTPPGPALLTILAEAAFDKDGNRVPDEWIGTYNVKWQKIINIEPTRPNTNTIRLYNRPTLSVVEQIIPFRQTITGSVITISSGTITGQYIGANVQLVGDDITNLQRQVTSDGTLVTATEPVFVRQSINGTFYAVINNVPFTSSIQKLQSSNAAKLTKYLTGSDGGAITRWTTSNYTMSYQAAPTYITSSLNRSFANIKLSNLTTFTGDIQRAKFYVRGIDEGQKYELFEDIVLEAIELTLSQSYTGEQIELGEIIDQPFIDENWESGVINNGVTYASGNVTASYNTSTLIDSVTILGPDTGSLYNLGSTVASLWTGIKQELSFDADAEYTFQADIVCLKQDADFDARMDIRLFGPNFSGGQGNQLGYLITSLNCLAGQTRRTFQNFVFNFTAPVADLAKLRFDIFGGQWFISKAKIVSSRESGFNPDQISVFSPVINRRFERLQFKAELYDANSNLVPLNIETDAIYFDGGNFVFRGDDHRIDGILTVAPSGSGPTLTSRGFNNKVGVFTPGQAISIGPPTPYVRNKNTAFFAGTSSAGPEISVGDKLYGYYDDTIDQFILEIDGIIRIGSGSNYIDIRSLLPNNPSLRISQFLSGSALDFYDVRGRNSVNAGLWYDQIGRMGYYTRGYNGFVGPLSTSLSSITSQFNPYQFPTQSVTLYTSSSITIPTDHVFFNEALYASTSFQISQLNVNENLTYRMNYTIDVLTSWTGYPSPSVAGQTLLADTTYYVVSSGTFPAISIADYPIFVPRDRTSDTLYVLLRLNAITYPTV